MSEAEKMRLKIKKLKETGQWDYLDQSVVRAINRQYDMANIYDTDAAIEASEILRKISI